jgi:hypothetical protein
MRYRSVSWNVALGLSTAPPLLAQAEAPGIDPKGRYVVYVAGGCVTFN